MMSASPGMTWNPYLLPVRALGKCGGYRLGHHRRHRSGPRACRSRGVPDNPYPADIINLSLGGTGQLPAPTIRT